MGIIEGPTCKLALCVALFMPIRLCDIVTVDALPAPRFLSDHRPGRPTWGETQKEASVIFESKYILYNTKTTYLCNVIQTLHKMLFVCFMLTSPLPLHLFSSLYCFPYLPSGCLMCH